MSEPSNGCLNQAMDFIKKHWKDAMIESGGAFTIALIAIMSETRWPSMGGLMYGLTVFYVTAMYETRTFNPILNVFYRPFFEIDHVLTNESKGVRGILAAIDFVFNIMGSAAGVFLFYWLMYDDKENPFLGLKFKYAETVDALGNITKTKTFDTDYHNQRPKVLLNHQGHRWEYSPEGHDMQAKAALGEAIGFVIIICALLEVRMLQKRLIENAKFKTADERANFKTKRAVHLGVAFTIASYSLGSYSGGLFNAVLDLWMRFAILTDMNWTGAASIGWLSTAYLLAFFLCLYATAAFDWGDWYNLTRIKSLGYEPDEFPDRKLVLRTSKVVSAPMQGMDEISKTDSLVASTSRANRSDNWDL